MQLTATTTTTTIVSYYYQQHLTPTQPPSPQKHHITRYIRWFDRIHFYTIEERQRQQNNR